MTNPDDCTGQNGIACYNGDPCNTHAHGVIGAAEQPARDAIRGGTGPAGRYLGERRDT